MARVRARDAGLLAAALGFVAFSTAPLLWMALGAVNFMAWMFP